MWEPQPLTTLRASKACRGENFTLPLMFVLLAGSYNSEVNGHPVRHRMRMGQSCEEGEMQNRLRVSPRLTWLRGVNRFGLGKIMDAFIVRFREW
jgi:hypothetical protein